MVFEEILNLNFLGNTAGDYLIALGIFIVVFIVLKIFKNVGIKKLKKLADHTRVEFDDLIIKFIQSIAWPFYFILALYIACQFIQLPNILDRVLYYALILIVTWYVIKSVQEVINFGVQRVISKRQKEDEKFEPGSLNILAKVLKGVVWLIAIIIILQNLGYNISALVAGLGIGGIAIAFALQNVLTDMFASFSIYFDKPFQVGDYIVIGDNRGTVKKIGIKSTRIQSTQGEELIISNKELTESRVSNYKKMDKRRITFKFGIEYNTSIDKVKKIPEIIKNVLKRFELVEIDRVHFKELGDFSLNFEAIFFVKTTDYAKYLDTQQEINLALMEEFEKQEIVFAYPSQTIYLSKD